MIGTGGSAIVAKTLGENEPEKANEYFSFLVYTTLIGGLLFSLSGFFFVKPLVTALGAEGELLNNCVLYARISFASLTFFMLQNVFQSFFVTAEKPKLGLFVIIAAGVTNMILTFYLLLFLILVSQVLLLLLFVVNASVDLSLFFIFQETTAVN